MTKNDSDYIFEKNFKRHLICRSKYYTPGMQAFLKNPDLLLEGSDVHYFKNAPGEASTVGLLTVDGYKVVVKRYNVKNIWHGLKLWFRKSRAMISWLNAHRLAAINIPTIEPIAVIEKRYGPLRNKAYFIYCYIDGDPCCNYFEKYQTLTPRYRQALESVAESMKKLKTARIHHRDCHHNNMVMLGDKVLLLDLDHMKQYRFLKWRFKKAHQKDIRQFIHYLGDNQQAKEYFQELIGEEGCEDGSKLRSRHSERSEESPSCLG